MFKEYMMKKLLQLKLKDVPTEQREKILKAFEKDPGLFLRIGEEIKTNTIGGKDQVTVAMEVLKNHQEEIAKLIK